jgi:molybdate/tungstate transport system permease protein
VTKEMFNTKKDIFSLILTLLGSLILLFIIAPLIRFVFSMSTSDFRGVFADREVWASISLTLRCSFLATIISTITGIPLAYILARKNFVGKNFIQGIIDLPVIIPHSVAGIALLFVFGRNSLFQQIFSPLGITFIGQDAGIILAMAFVSVPFLVNSAREGFISVPQRYENVARSLGATPARVFFTVSLPLAWRSILSGMVMMWARGISEFGSIMIIAYHPMTTSVLIFQRFTNYGLNYARSAAVLLIAVCVTVFIILRIVSNNPEKEAGSA